MQSSSVKSNTTTSEVATKNSFWRSSFLWGTAFIWGLFLVYMIVAVPLIEGQSASQIPAIDPTGAFKAQSAGRWLSLFPEKSWQRDESDRNVIQAKNTILIFKDYFIQENGNVEVRKLSLLVFDQSEDEEENQADLNRKSLQGFPLVIDADEGAILKTQKPTVGNFGEVEEIRFLGPARFSRRNSDYQKSFEIKTQNLVITPQGASTPDKVTFRFGDSLGTANGLKIQFGTTQTENLVPQKLTQVDQLNSLAFESIEHFMVRVPKKLPEIGFHQYAVRCSGPATFEHVTKQMVFHQQVVLQHIEEKSELHCKKLAIFFSEKEKPNRNKKSKKSFLSGGLEPNRFLATGMPAEIRYQERTGHVFAENINYLFDENTVTLTSPKNIWVTLQTKEAKLSVPKIIYRGVKKDRVVQGRSINKPAEGNGAFRGQIEAIGNGTLVLQPKPSETNPSGKRPEDVVVNWSERMWVRPDQENPLQTVISLFGSVKTSLGPGKQVQSDTIHLWTKAQEKKNNLTKESLSDPFSGAKIDFLLAQGKVKMETEKIQAHIDEARVFLADKLPLNSNQHLSLSSRSDQSTLQSQSAFPARIRHRVMKVLTGHLHESIITIGDKEKTKILGKKLTVKMRPKSNSDRSEKMDIQYLEIQGNVQVFPLDYIPGVTRTAPKFYMNASRVVGQAGKHNSKHSNLPNQPAPITTDETPPLRWTIYGWEKKRAILKSKGVSFEGHPIYFDQINNQVWTDNPGVMTFPITGKIQVNQNDGFRQNSFEREKIQQAKPVTGQGKVKWNGQLYFDGKTAQISGLVDCQVHNRNEKGNREDLRAFADQIKIVLEFPIRMDQQNRVAENPEVESLQLSQLANSKTQTRLYQLESDPAGKPISEYLLLCKAANYQTLERKVQIGGPGKLWYISQPKASNKESDKNRVAFNTEKAPELEFLKVEFREKFDGFMDLGKFVFSGPSKSVHGKLPNWENKDESNLIDPMRLTCNWLSLNQWQPKGRLQKVTEIDAKGSVHVQGADFEALASELRYSQRKDLFTVQGDARSAARFFQIDPITGKKNMLAADLIKYSPSQQWFQVDGHKAGDITSFSTRRRSGSTNR